jgi:hypothetical protein
MGSVYRAFDSSGDYRFYSDPTTWLPFALVR